MVPNFNSYDYALSFEIMEYSRHMRLPIYYFEFYFNYLFKNKLIFEKIILDKKNKNELLNRKFCNFIISNFFHASTDRVDFFYQLSKYKNVDSGGRAFNNIGGPIKNKLTFQVNYKFSLAFENTSSDGYVTEKILDAFLARSIPIYWGSKSVQLDFNTKSFINVHDFANFSEAISYIKYVDQNDEKYLEILSQSILNGNFYNNLSVNTILNFLEKALKEGKKRQSSMSGRNNLGDYITFPKYLKYIALCVPISKYRKKFRNYLMASYFKRKLN